MRYVAFIFLTLFGCDPSSTKDFKVEGEAKCRELVLILERVETGEDLLQIESVLKKKFEEIVDLLLLTEKYLAKHPTTRGIAVNPYNDDLLYELKRVYKISGGREILERAQKEPLIRLERSGTQRDSSSL